MADQKLRKGRARGRKAKLTPAQVAEAKRLATETAKPMREIAEEFDVSRSTLYRNFADTKKPLYPDRHEGLAERTANTGYPK